MSEQNMWTGKPYPWSKAAATPEQQEAGKGGDVLVWGFKVANATGIKVGDTVTAMFKSGKTRTDTVHSIKGPFADGNAIVLCTSDAAKASLPAAPAPAPAAVENAAPTEAPSVEVLAERLDAAAKIVGDLAKRVERLEMWKSGFSPAAESR